MNGKLIIEYWPLDRFRPYDRNPRKHGKAIGRMADQLERFGWRRPVLARSSDGLIIDGHLCLAAAERAGFSEAPVLPTDDLSVTEIKALRIAMNASSSWADWDNGKLKLEIADLRMSGLDLKWTGLNPPLLAEMAVSETLPGSSVLSPADSTDLEISDSSTPNSSSGVSTLPLAVVLRGDDIKKWHEWKESCGAKSDRLAFMRLMEVAGL